MAQEINVPIIETGVVDGAVLFETGKPVPGLRLQLVDRKGRVVKDTVSSFDGFYIFEFIKPGQYTLRADPSLGVSVPEREITISPDALFAYGFDMTLYERPLVNNKPVTVNVAAVKHNLPPIVNKLKALQGALSNALAGQL
jgi:hypothetical protein